jgi:hypothetical protein
MELEKEIAEQLVKYTRLEIGSEEFWQEVKRLADLDCGCDYFEHLGEF